MVYTHVHLKVF